jgi:(p)ppGpp synthase/HD superfamily hydrolase
MTFQQVDDEGEDIYVDDMFHEFLEVKKNGKLYTMNHEIQNDDIVLIIF